MIATGPCRQFVRADRMRIGRMPRIFGGEVNVVRGVMRILLKPFRARNLIDTFSEFAATPPVPPARATGAAQAPQGARPA